MSMDGIEIDTTMEENESKILYTNGWNEMVEKLTFIASVKCASYRIMHHTSALYYKRINDIVSVITIILVTLIATNLFNNENYILQIISGVVLYIISLLTALKEFFGLTKISETHKLFAIRFSALYNNIQRQICLNTEDRENGKDYVTWLNSELDNLLFANPDIPNRIKTSIDKEVNKLLNINGLFEFSFIESQKNKLIPEIDQPVKSLDPKVKYELDRYMHLS